ncbi:MAG: GTPase ObgE [Helicobacteraceae bacterium]|jgi:GTP-binding protein|nr:GTPase ObgE [Helicobacteraceae bacterium]
MFIDRVEITVASGKGGAGCVSFRREKFVPQGGPDGGDGGKGGDLVFVVDPNADTLSRYRGKRVYKAQNGAAGGSRNKTGASGEDLALSVPPGAQVFDAKTDEKLLDLTNVGDRVVFLKGGKGGQGNVHFKSSTNQRPTFAQRGIDGETREIRLELKLIADAGLVGFPNVGKSTLISAVSHAKPEIADYAFTTLTPHLGVVRVGEYKDFTLADIPGVIEGASEGRGLGLEFLRHIERTRVLLFALDTQGVLSIAEQQEKLLAELKKYSEELYGRSRAIVFTRTDADPSAAKAKIAEYFKAKKLKPKQDEQGFESYEDDETFYLPISAVSGYNLKDLVFKLDKLIDRAKNANRG